jgi:hypothetical protein
MWPPMAELAREHRAMVLARLGEIELELGQISAWLDAQGEEKASILTEDAWRDIMAAQHLLERDLVARASLVHGRMSQDHRGS